MQLTAFDRESGVISFRKLAGDKEVIMSVSIRKEGDHAKVNTVVTTGGGLAIRGLHEEFIHNFHVYLFRSLGISDPAERRIGIDVIS